MPARQKSADDSKSCTFIRGCAGPDLLSPRDQVSCAGSIERSAMDGKSFGTPFTTHAMLCRAHRSALGYRLDEGATMTSTQQDHISEARQ